MFLKSFFIINIIFIFLLSYWFYKIITPNPLPKFDLKKYWGPGAKPLKLDNSIREFKINVSNEILEDLKWRLDHLKQLKPALEGIQHQYGINSKLVKEIVEFWKTKYNWREREIYLNKFPQFKTNIQGLDIHYIHIKPQNYSNKEVIPLLILHGWPGSLREFYDIIPELITPRNDQDFLFEIVAPHLPGFGFSDAASKPGLGTNQIAVIMKNLMQRLGHKKFYCQGGDMGAMILQSLSVVFPEVVLGLHTNMPLIYTPLSLIKYMLGTIYPDWIIRPDHYHILYPLSEVFQKLLRESGYLHLQATKPDTVGVALTDSPVGLMAYILEKFIFATNHSLTEREDGGLLEYFSYTDLLDNIMLYWVTGSITTTFRLYSETFNKEHHEPVNILRHPVLVPTAISRCEFDFYPADGVISEIFPNNVQLTDFPGGHFAALQLPKSFANDVILGYEKIRNFNNKH